MKKNEYKQLHNFFSLMNHVLQQNAENDHRDQKKLLNDLFALEEKFRQTLLSTNEGKLVYKKFMDYILCDGNYAVKGLKENYKPKNKKDLKNYQMLTSVETRGILKAKIYFRERQNTLIKKMFKAFSEKDHEKLHKLKINPLFAIWVVQNYRGPKASTLRNYLQQIIHIRKLLCENNLPLAINRAKIFWSKNIDFSLERMDLIQACAAGLLTAIDKFVPPYSTVFRSVAIGRMVLNMTEMNSNLIVKLPSKAKRILYRVKNAMQKENIHDDDKVLQYVKQSFKDVQQEDISTISAANTILSIDELVQAHNGEKTKPLYEIIPDNNNLFDTIESNDMREKLFLAMENLETIEQKVLLMKHGNIYQS